jgi:uncharacterized protein YdaT
MHQDIEQPEETLETFQRLRVLEVENAVLKEGYDELRERLLTAQRERDQLLELVTFYERELIRERGYI